MNIKMMNTKAMMQIIWGLKKLNYCLVIVERNQGRKTEVYLLMKFQCKITLKIT